MTFEMPQMVPVQYSPRLRAHMQRQPLSHQQSFGEAVLESIQEILSDPENQQPYLSFAPEKYWIVRSYGVDISKYEEHTFYDLSIGFNPQTKEWAAKLQYEGEEHFTPGEDQELN